jgi:huntingtin-interacting protein 1-related protein
LNVILTFSFNQQHRLLLNFYYECSNLRYLTSLISVPRLPQANLNSLSIANNKTPPNVFEGEEQPPALPARPTTRTESPAPTPAPKLTDPEPISDFWSNEQAQEQREYEETQRLLEQQRQAEMQRQQMLALQQQREFEAQQRMQAEQQRLAQEQLLQQQYAQQTQGRLAELEREILNMRGQYDKDQLLLEQYDRVSPPFIRLLLMW